MDKIEVKNGFVKCTDCHKLILVEYWQQHCSGGCIEKLIKKEKMKREGIMSKDRIKMLLKIVPLLVIALIFYFLGGKITEEQMELSNVGVAYVLTLLVGVGIGFCMFLMFLIIRRKL